MGISADPNKQGFLTSSGYACDVPCSLWPVREQSWGGKNREYRVRAGAAGGSGNEGGDVLARVVGL